MPDASTQGPSLLLSSRAWHNAPVADFIRQSLEMILGAVASNTDFALEIDQRDAWVDQIRTLQTALTGLSGHVFIEFSIPRMGKRIDAVLLAGPLIFAIEFKTSRADRAALNQVWDYGLDLKNFHAGSHTAAIVPILVAPDAGSEEAHVTHAADDGVFEPFAVRPENLRNAIVTALASKPGPDLQVKAWESSPYKPTPTIIEAARSLYQQHGVEAIARSDSGAQNLAVTSGRILEIVDEARVHNRKSICFVTGVPGAGKTLVGLNVATRRTKGNPEANAVFLSGNVRSSRYCARPLRATKSRERSVSAKERARVKWGRVSRRSSRTCTTFAMTIFNTQDLRQSMLQSSMKPSARGTSTRQPVSCVARKGAPTSRSLSRSS